jgi:hypothetical protein
MMKNIEIILHSSVIFPHFIRKWLLLFIYFV